MVVRLMGVEIADRDPATKLLGVVHDRQMTNALVLQDAAGFFEVSMHLTAHHVRGHHLLDQRLPICAIFAENGKYVACGPRNALTPSRKHAAPRISHGAIWNDA